MKTKTVTRPLLQHRLSKPIIATPAPGRPEPPGDIGKITGFGEGGKNYQPLITKDLKKETLALDDSTTRPFLAWVNAQKGERMHAAFSEAQATLAKALQNARQAGGTSKPFGSISFSANGSAGDLVPIKAAVVAFLQTLGVPGILIVLLLTGLSISLLLDLVNFISRDLTKANKNPSI